MLATRLAQSSVRNPDSKGIKWRVRGQDTDILLWPCVFLGVHTYTHVHIPHIRGPPPCLDNPPHAHLALSLLLNLSGPCCLVQKDFCRSLLE